MSSQPSTDHAHSPGEATVKHASRVPCWRHANRASDGMCSVCLHEVCSLCASTVLSPRATFS